MWSRAVQLQSSCHCRLCLNTTNTLVRRSTTAASRRKVTAADLFTACYTTILGSATIIDANRKDARRKELDERLERAKAALGNPGIQEGPLNEPLQDYDKSPTTKRNERRNRSAAKKRLEKNTSSLLEELASLCDVTRNPSGRSTWMQDQIDWVRVEATIVAEENDPRFALREPRSSTQLEMTTNTIVQLINRLIGQSQVRRSDVVGQSDEETGNPLTKAEENILKELDSIRTGLHYPSYAHPLSDPTKSRNTRSLLSESVRRIFNRASSSTEAVGNICYNLLTSSFPPTIHTYNALIAGFNRIQRSDLAQIVVDSYIHDTAWPATQQTMVCLLNHYRAKDDLRGLRNIIARMRGVKDTGLHFSIVSKDSIYSKEWLAWASEHCASRKHAFVERAQRGSDVFDAIIRGWLHHGDLSAASMIFIACIRNGSLIPIQTLQKLLTACLAAVDHSTARHMVRGIVKNLRNFVVMLDRTLRLSTAAMSLKVVDSLSNLIRICGLPLHNALSVVDDVHVRSLLRLEYLLSTAKIRFELNASIRLQWKVLEALESPGSLVSRLDAAVKIFNASQWDRIAFENYETIARLLSIDKRLQDLERKGKVLANQAKAMIIKITTGLDLDPASVLFSGPHESQRQQVYLPALSNALESLELHGDSMTQDHIKAQLVQGIPNPQLARRLKLAGQSENMCSRTSISFYGPDAVTFHRPDNRHYSRSIREVEEKVLDLEDFLKIILFSYLGVKRQRWLRVLYPNWYTMPLEPLVEYHIRRQSRDKKTRAEQIPDAQQDNFFTGSTQTVEETITESPAPSSAVGYTEIDRQLNVVQPVTMTCLPDSHVRTRDSMSYFVAVG